MKLSDLAGLALAAVLASQAVAQGAGSPTAWVDPFIGTDGAGHVFPGAMVPFGMVAPGPDNADRGRRHSSGYQHRDGQVLGFSNTHVSGADIPELGDVLLMPASGRRWTPASTTFATRIDKASERARPGYYSAYLPQHGVRVELTAQQRVAIQRYTYDRDGRSQLMVDLQHGLGLTDPPRVTQADWQVDAARGEITATVQVSNRVNRQYSVVLALDRPIARVQTLPVREGDQAPRLLLDLEPGAARTVVVRVAFSTVDVEGARRNLADAGRPTFQQARLDADRAWAALLGRVRIDADERTRRIFYSALYRCFMHPSDIADADGRVRGPRGVVMSARGGRYYSTLSLWATFRAVHPLFTLLVPERVDGFILTLLDHHRQQGYLPLWTVWGRETWSMIGNPSLPLIADALAKGFRGFDAQEALEAMVTTSTASRPDAPPWAQRDWFVLDRHGYLPFDVEPGESVSKTLDHGIGDDAVARVARLLGRADLERVFSQRAAGWRQLLDPATQVVRGRDRQGGWRTPFDPLQVTSPGRQPGDYTEASAWQYTPTAALHDPAGLRDALGGRRALGLWLERMLGLVGTSADGSIGQQPMIGHLAHGNEPGHHVAWLHAWSHAPWRGQLLARRIARDFYGDGPNGLIAHDDAGRMSAWLVFATLGLYPAVPASGNYVAGAPLVRGASIDLAGGRTLRIVADGYPPDIMSGHGLPPALTRLASPLLSPRVASDVRLNGRSLDITEVPHTELVQGGELRFTMSLPD
jgi:predicted alpha-1,2-mannosidase